MPRKRKFVHSMQHYRNIKKKLKRTEISSSSESISPYDSDCQKNMFENRRINANDNTFSDTSSDGLIDETFPSKL